VRRHYKPEDSRPTAHEYIVPNVESEMKRDLISINNYLICINNTARTV
jgi:hypothetical protein